MEAHQHQQQQISDVHDQATGSNSRQTSTRWTPTADQIRILKELYHSTGLRSPNTEQIQRISARLRQYGKIEGKNVFYWFQNHKARERQQQKIKKTTNCGTNASNFLQDANSAAALGADTRRHHRHHLLPLRSHDHNDYVINRSWKYPCFTTQGYYHSSTSASDGPILSANGQMGNQYHCGYESVNMEQHFRGCSISPLASSSGFNGGNISNNLSSWENMDKFCSRTYNLFDSRKPPAHPEGPEYEEEGGDCGAGRTLPLFPMHGEDHRINHQSDGYDHRGGCINGSPFASLELTLNSCTRESRD